MLVRIARKCVALLVLGVLVGCGHFVSDKAEDKSEEKGEEIPLKSISATFKQKEGHLLNLDETKQPGKQLARLVKQHPSGASNAFLVYGRDVNAAIRATSEALTSERSVARPTDPGDGQNSKQVWLAIFFGISSSTPPAWQIDSIVRRGTVFRVRVSKPEESKGRTKDIHYCFAWVPLGELAAGRYTVELFDCAEDEVMLLRRVRVGTK